MKKALKLLFSQTAVVVLLLLLQLMTLVTTLWRLSQYSAYINAALLLISMLVVLRVVSSHTNPSFQLAWVILILGLPVFGGLFYLFIYSQQHSRRYLRQLEQRWRWLSLKLPQEAAAKELWEPAPSIIWITWAFTPVTAPGRDICLPAKSGVRRCCSSCGKHANTSIWSFSFWKKVSSGRIFYPSCGSALRPAWKSA